MIKMLTDDVRKALAAADGVQQFEIDMVKTLTQPPADMGKFQPPMVLGRYGKFPTLANFVPVVPMGEGKAIAPRVQGAVSIAGGNLPQTPEGNLKAEHTWTYTEGVQDLKTFGVYVRGSKAIIELSPGLTPNIEYTLRRLSLLAMSGYIAAAAKGAGAGAGTAGVAAAAAQSFGVCGIMPDTIAMHPSTFFTLMGLRADPWDEGDADDLENAGLEFMGMDVAIEPSLLANTYVVGPYEQASILCMRENGVVTVGMINDDFTKNMRTVLCDTRAAWEGVNDNAFVKGTL